jgi:hypothetical protein
MVLTAIFSSVAFIFKWKTGFIKPVVEEKEEEKEEVHERRKMPKLRYHQIFVQLDELEAYFLTRYKHSDFGRQLLATEMIIHKIRAWRPILKEYAIKVDECCDICNGEDACNKISNMSLQTFIDGMTNYVNWHKKDVVMTSDGDRQYTKEDKETMDIYIQKFITWHSTREELTKIMISEIIDSNMYDNCYERAYDVLHAYSIAFISMKLDSEKTLKDLNGSISGKTFLSTTIGS